MKKIKVLLVFLLVLSLLFLSACNIDSFGDKASNFVKDGITLINDNISSTDSIDTDTNNMNSIDKFLTSTIGTTLIEMAIQLCATLIIFLIVRFLIWNKVTEILEARKKMVRDAVAERDNSLNDAKMALVDANKTKEEATKEANRIIESAKKRAYNEAEDIKMRAKDDAKLRIDNANEEIERMKNENIADIKKQIVEVAYAMASKIVEKEIEEDKYDIQVDKFMKEDK